MSLVKRLSFIALLLQMALADDDDASVLDTIATAHGTLASLTFLVLFPVGAIIMRTCTFKATIYVHAAIQILAYAMLVCVAALGIHLCLASGEGFNYAHPKIGLFLFSVLFFQIPTGLVHHMFFKTKGKRTISSFWHVYIGRPAIILGMVNGGLGLAFAEAEMKWMTAYAVVAGVMGALYLASIDLRSSRDRVTKEDELTSTSSRGYDSTQNAKQV